MADSQIWGVSCGGDGLLGPVAVGGVGGSGTRVVAGFLKELGFYIGDDRNAADDNLWFTLLLARSKWFSNSSREEIAEALGIFEKAMTGGLSVGREESVFLTRAAVDLSFSEYLYWDQTPIKRLLKSIPPARWALTLTWSAMRFLNIARSATVSLGQYIGWAWKEPCTYVYLEHLSRQFEQVKYVHVIRNGLDMAHSENQGHLIAWGSLFGVEVPRLPELLPKASLDYWIKANEATVAQGRRLLGDKFLVINFDELCVAPRQQVEQLVRFLDLDSDTADMDSLCALVRKPRTFGRHRQYDVDFEPDALEAVRKLGFTVEAG